MKTLYKLAKTGKIQVYTAWPEGDSVYSKSGQLNGAMTPSSFKCTGKNLGKSNETSPELQATIEWRAKIQAKRDKGYFDTIEEAQNTIVFLPMLAKNGRTLKIKYPCDAQPKLDGGRCMAPPKAPLMTRGGKTYVVDHVSKEVDYMRSGELVLDGELYIHGTPLQDIMSFIKKPKAGSENVEYWIYDCYNPLKPDAPWSVRKEWLQRMIPNLYLGEVSLCPHIKIVPTYRVNNHEEMIALHDKFVALGYEGIILRYDSGVYDLGHRSSNLIKYKNFEDDEYKIIAFKEGIGKFVGCVIWRCVTPEGEEFDVTPKGTIIQKKDWYKNAEAQIGKDLTVRYWGKTNKGIPAPAVGIVIRDYE